MFRILKKSLKTGVVTGQHPAAAPLVEASTSEAKDKANTVPFLSNISRRGYRLMQCL